MAGYASMDNEFARRLFRNRSLKPQELAVYRRQLRAFRKKFGREMGPDDPFFFDPAADAPQVRAPEYADEALLLLTELMGQAGVDPAAIYAFRKTRGIFPTAGHPLGPDEMEEWNSAVEEYHTLLRRSAAQ
jgi:hypothetical protein